MSSRSFARVILALFEPRHWQTLVKSFSVVSAPLPYLYRYVTGRGVYPCRINIRTPCGECSVVVNRFEDLFTINEIFVWEVYGGVDVNGVTGFVDIGGNIGLASLYFLTRNSFSRGVMVEPLEENIGRAKCMLERFRDRIEIMPAAVAIESGTLDIGVEETGRYSGVDCLGIGVTRTVTAIGVNELLHATFNSIGCISIVKVDCEGAERFFMPVINDDNLKVVARFVLEAEKFDDKALVNSGFIKRMIFNDAKGGGVFDYSRIS